MTEESVLRRVDDYLIVEEIGRGAMGVVYRAVNVSLDQERALKELRTKDDPVVLERFVHEARVEAMMQHQNIAVVHQLLWHEGIPWIAMEYFPRGTLRPFVGSLDDRQAVDCLRQILRGLAHAHAKGVIHRDLKPENVMIDHAGTLKIADFGIARRTSAPSLTADGWFVGDPRYVAPEVVQGEEATATADLYAVGVMAYEFFTGGHPFGDTPDRMLPMRKATVPAPSLNEPRPDLDRRITHWVDVLLDRDPRRRPASAEQALTELEAIAERLWGAGWRAQPLPTEASEMAPPMLPPPAKLVGVRKLRTYADLDLLLVKALLRPLNVIVLLAVALLATAVALATDAIRVPWVVTGCLVAYAVAVGATFFDQRQAALTGTGHKPSHGR